MTSKSCEAMVLDLACALVRRFIPLPLRRLWGEFRSPLWAKDPGPMRLVILDNRSDEQCGMIPELMDPQVKGRNSTYCPFVFSSREDLLGGIGGGTWPVGKLLAHESVHGCDMVIRQLVDPCFHEMAQDLFDRASVATVYNGMYASTSRDEYLAEVVIIALGLVQKEGDNEYVENGLVGIDQLVMKDPEVVDLLTQFFTLG